MVPHLTDQTPHRALTKLSWGDYSTRDATGSQTSITLDICKPEAHLSQKRLDAGDALIMASLLKRPAARSLLELDLSENHIVCGDPLRGYGNLNRLPGKGGKGDFYFC